MRWADHYKAHAFCCVLHTPHFLPLHCCSNIPPFFDSRRWTVLTSPIHLNSLKEAGAGTAHTASHWRTSRVRLLTRGRRRQLRDGCAFMPKYEYSSAFSTRRLPTRKGMAHRRAGCMRFRHAFISPFLSLLNTAVAHSSYHTAAYHHYLRMLVLLQLYYGSVARRQNMPWGELTTPTAWQTNPSTSAYRPYAGIIYRRSAEPVGGGGTHLPTPRTTTSTAARRTRSIPGKTSSNTYFLAAAQRTRTYPAVSAALLPHVTCLVTTICISSTAFLGSPAGALA